MSGVQATIPISAYFGCCLYATIPVLEALIHPLISTPQTTQPFQSTLPSPIFPANSTPGSIGSARRSNPSLNTQTGPQNTQSCSMPCSGTCRARTPSLSSHRTSATWRSGRGPGQIRRETNVAYLNAWLQDAQSEAIACRLAAQLRYTTMLAACDRLERPGQMLMAMMWRE